jgi:NO-binding membrane sensor protein with MHYT domain
MAEVHHFEYGWITPLMAYCLSVLGSLLGLICTARVRSLPTRKRISWLVLAAVAIGGTGIWVMHFMAMLGFGVVGSDIRYDVPTTALSALVAVVVVGLGLFIVGLGKPTAIKIAIGGVLAGLGVNAMHYMGMAAMRLDGDIAYDMLRVGASIAIAVVAATVALFLSVTVRTGAAIFGSAMVMGVAVCGMHYTGMSAMSVTLEEHGHIAGATSMTLIAPIALAVVFVVMGLIYSVLAAPTDEDRAGAAYINARLSGTPAPDNSRWTPEFAPAGGAGRERPGGLWAANREAAARPPADTAGQGRGAPSAGGLGFGGAGLAGAASAGSNGAATGANGSDVAPGLGASLLATQPGAQAGGGRWEGPADQGRPVSPAPVEYQSGTSSEPLPQRTPGQQPAAGAPRPPTSATLAQQFQNRPRTTQDH